ncbi:hypothetical protein K4A83_02335 [Spirulina subsalsa FACHB-351]|uniref:Uncharacterized protein n=1 Tax=Spirulina subsalsa FACHB-351 TaxID=234711 RepID=A0ABT3L0T3_9CYAN|nr:hypothetical protein [Spirulina subsalsa]MCW6035111.1 hypothetical protein [Spirulina subsalsa FACHB-351]
MSEQQGELDSFLTNLQNQFVRPPTQSPPVSQPKPPVSAATDDFLQELQAQFSQVSQPKEPTVDLDFDHLLEKWQKPKSEPDLAQQLQEKEKLLRIEREQAWRRQQQEKALKRQAEMWLKQLDPDSDEGLWFEEFAYHYPSKLAAAMDYLKALCQES